jgi:Lectin C-type domain
LISYLISWLSASYFSDGNCYYFSVAANKTFDEAHVACTKEVSIDKGLPRADLVSIHSSLENDFIITQARRAHHRHHGRPGEDGSGRPPMGPPSEETRTMYDFWIGLHHNEGRDEDYEWTDQSPFDYNNWHIGEDPSWNYGVFYFL